MTAPDHLPPDQNHVRQLANVIRVLSMDAVELAKSGFYQDIRKTGGEPGWALLEKYVGPLA